MKELQMNWFDIKTDPPDFRIYGFHNCKSVRIKLEDGTEHLVQYLGYGVFKDVSASFTSAPYKNVTHWRPERRIEMLDGKFKIMGFNEKTGAEYDESNSVLFLGKDRALPATLKAYRAECERLGSDQAHLGSIDLLIQRVEEWQENNPTKVPD